MLISSNHRSAYRHLSYANLMLISGMAYYYSLQTFSGILALSTFLIQIAENKNPFDSLLQTFFELSKESNYQMNYRNIDSFINFNEKNLSNFLITKEKDEIYFTSLSNIIRTCSFSYIILTREIVVNGMKNIIDPILSDKMFSLMEKHFYPLKIPHEQQTDLLSKCTCSTKDLHNIAFIINYYKQNIKNNMNNNSKKLLSFLFQSRNYIDLCSTIMFAFKEGGLNVIADLKGTDSSMYHNPSSFMVNKRIKKNRKEALDSSDPPSYLPEILGKILGLIHFSVRSFITGYMCKSLFPSNPSIYLLNVQNMKRSVKNNSIEEVQEHSSLLDAINPSCEKAYICFTSNSEIDPALVNRHILLTSQNKKSLHCFVTAIRRKIFQLKWKGILTSEPLEEIITQLTFATYGKYSAKDVGWAIEQRFDFLFHNKKKLPFTLASILKSF